MQVTPVVKTYRKRDTNATSIMPNQITAVKAYGICSKCNNVFSVFMSSWVRNGFKCSYCKTKLDYVKAAWRKVPNVVENTDLVPYFAKYSAKYQAPTNEVTDPTPSKIDDTPTLVALKRSTAMLNAINNNLELLHNDNNKILDLLENILNAWR